VNNTHEGPAGLLAPHPPLTGYYADEAARRRWVRQMFDRTAIDYDRIERVMSFGIGVSYRRDALIRAGLAQGMTMLDIGSGTGLTALAAEQVVGGASLIRRLDPSLGMLASGSQQCRASRAIAGCAEDLPFGDASADYVSMGFALRHVADLRAAFTEFHRVLRPGGRMCVLEITPPESALGRHALKVYMRRWIPFVAGVIGRSPDLPRLMRYYWDSTEACVPPVAVLHALREAGFVDVRRHVDRRIFSEYSASRSAVAS
jgi:demethylmenaquinone methyltransferase/2-methoxy-6-polyprenyl-1,4-benzoquinol methylase